MRLAWLKDSDATAPFQVRRIHVWSGRPQRAKSFRAESRAAQYGQKIDRVGYPAAAYLSSGNQSSDRQTARSEVVAKAFRARDRDRRGRGQCHGRPLDPRPLGAGLTDEEVMVAAHIGNDRLVHLVASDPD